MGASAYKSTVAMISAVVCSSILPLQRVLAFHLIEIILPSALCKVSSMVLAVATTNAVTNALGGADAPASAAPNSTAESCACLTDTKRPMPCNDSLSMAVARRDATICLDVRSPESLHLHVSVLIS